MHPQSKVIVISAMRVDNVVPSGVRYGININLGVFLSIFSLYWWILSQLVCLILLELVFVEGELGKCWCSDFPGNGVGGF